MICKNCGYKMVEGIIICPNCLKNVKNFKPQKINFTKEKKKRTKSNKKNDEINQWYDMGLF